jgi:hypothetical protein
MEFKINKILYKKKSIVYYIMVINLSFVKPKNKLKSKIFKCDLCNEIVRRVLEFENYLSLRNDPELLKFICDLVENGVKKTDDKNKVDKKELVLEIYFKIFNISENEKKHISDQIEFLCDNELITKVFNVKKNGKLFINYIKSKL